MIKTIIFDLIDTLYDPNSKKLFPDTLTTLDLLKNNFSLILVTDFKEDKKRLLDDLGLEKYFDNIIISNKSNNLFESILNGNSIRASECLVIGDNEKNEIQIARNLNLNYLVINRKKVLSNSDSIGSLIEIILFDKISEDILNKSTRISS